MAVPFDRRPPLTAVQIIHHDIGGGTINLVLDIGNNSSKERPSPAPFQTVFYHPRGARLRFLSQEIRRSSLQIRPSNIDILVESRDA